MTNIRRLFESVHEVQALNLEKLESIMWALARLLGVDDKLNEMEIISTYYTSEYFICTSSKFFLNNNYMIIKDNNNPRMSK